MYVVKNTTKKLFKTLEKIKCLCYAKNKSIRPKQKLQIKRKKHETEIVSSGATKHKTEAFVTVLAGE